ncbi:DNA repair protein RecN [Oharaeibacter diazotrophicus]|uniref:DNA repair protein RecN n=2 Tax=Oharaeibacter diazotrophicus TaxID=1920512 RepID=A0A4R6RH17_9HYPH|nr:DNA repair protein RecN [Oharaeibacter diazotrophicus]TDP85554.1 DNA replication and repair protein RecN [Oharaeibacter diazotrophicus]BBE74525.1 DNA repair protein RecN [Pleomorphomonas sp. SM30]GLS75776.1 DNA repair protein RecN [Oharaeibacter diazotrophicus]
MLQTLSIRDIVLIERLEIEFSPGLTVLTGETGAGKSILLDALSLALGGRGDAGLVRHGADQGQVTAVFALRPDHPVRAVLADNDIDDDGDLILRRVQSADGRTRAFVNDQAVGAALLRRIGAGLVEIHGQHDDRALVDAAMHRSLIDAFGGLEADAVAVAAAHGEWRRAERAVSELERRIESARREADYLRGAVEDLTKLSPEPGEETDLAARRQGMMRAEKVAVDLREAWDQLNGSGSPIPELSSLMRRLERKGEVAALVGGALAALSGALDQLEEARAGFEQALRAADYDPAELERVEERLFAIRAAARKFSVQPDDLAALAARMAADLADLDAGEDRLGELARAAAAARATYDARAAALSRAREKAARQLEAAVAAELPALKLERARFIVTTTTDPEARAAEGIDVVEFWVQTNPGTRPGPMLKVASGGELSRFLLALKVSLADKGSAPTLVFDEIDTGVGGAVAEAIGTRLARLAGGVQVLSVTHAPQVAARAGNHLLIAKEAVEGGARVATSVQPIGADRRREEIARMLAGSRITPEARAAADKLIAGE